MSPDRPTAPDPRQPSDRPPPKPCAPRPPGAPDPRQAAPAHPPVRDQAPQAPDRSSVVRHPSPARPPRSRHARATAPQQHTTAAGHAHPASASSPPTAPRSRTHRSHHQIQQPTPNPSTNHDINKVVSAKPSTLTHSAGNSSTRPFRSPQGRRAAEHRHDPIRLPPQLRSQATDRAGHRSIPPADAATVSGSESVELRYRADAGGGRVGRVVVGAI